LNGQYLLVGAPHESGGKVRLFKLTYDNNTSTTSVDVDWKRTFNGRSNGDSFGHALAMLTTESISAIAVGAPNANAGSGYVNVILSDKPSFESSCRRVVLSGSKGINFGWSVALTMSENSGILAVGAPYYKDGAVYLYSFSKSLHNCSVASLNGGIPLRRPSEMFTSFGSSVAFGKSKSSNEFQQGLLSHLFVSAPVSSLPALYGDGEVYSYVYNSHNKTYELEKIFRPAFSSIGIDQGFGYSIAASDQSLLIIGSPYGISV